MGYTTDVRENQHRRDNRRFVTGTYTCRSCQKLTRETGGDESSVELCRACYDEAGWENEHGDGFHVDAPVSECPYCVATKEGSNG